MKKIVFSALSSKLSPLSSKLSTLLILTLCCTTAIAVDDVEEAQFNFSRHDACEFITIPYISVDNQNNPVVLSTGICWPTESYLDKTPRKIKFIVLNNHPTIGKDSEASTGSKPLSSIEVMGIPIAPHGAMNLMTTEDGLVISPDYLGFGYSRNSIHPYCNHTLTARNVIDGFVAAMDTVKARGIEIDENYYTYNIGYSQGGAVSMGVQKFLETEASQQVRDLFRLKKSICGAGPYDIPLTYRELVEEDSLTYPCSLAMTLIGAMAAYKEGCMKQVDIDSIYANPEFRRGIEEIVSEKESTTDSINLWMTNFFGRTKISARDILRPEVLDHSSNAGRALDKTVSKCNLLDGEWIPETPITLYHFTGDQVVPYSNSLEAVKLFGDKVKLYNEKDTITCQSEMLRSALPLIKPNPHTHSDYGTPFFLYVIDGILRKM